MYVRASLAMGKLWHKRVSYDMGMEIRIEWEIRERKRKEVPISVGNGTLQGREKQAIINIMDICGPQKTPYNKKGEGKSKVHLQRGRGESLNLSAWGTDEEALLPREQHLEWAFCPARVCETAGRATLDSLPLNFTKNPGRSPMRIIAIDVSKRQLELYDASQTLTIERDEDAFRQYLRGAKKRWGEVKVLWEATGTYTSLLWKVCEAEQVEAAEVCGSKIRSMARALGLRLKNDRVDAKVIYRYAEITGEALWHSHGRAKACIVDLRTALTYYHGLEKMLSQLRGLKESLSQVGEHTTWMVERIETQMGQVKKLKKEAVGRMLKRISEDKALKEDYRRLCSIKGIGPITAIHLLVMFHAHEGANRREITALFGLDPVEHSSGEKRRKSRISKKGWWAARSALYMAAVSAVRFNRRIRAFYERLIQRGKVKKVALVAAARKLLLIAFACWKKGEFYRPALDT